jgi:hypothetical protein
MRSCWREPTIAWIAWCSTLTFRWARLVGDSARGGGNSMAATRTSMTSSCGTWPERSRDGCGPIAPGNGRAWNLSRKPARCLWVPRALGMRSRAPRSCGFAGRSYVYIRCFKLPALRRILLLQELAAKNVETKLHGDHYIVCPAAWLLEVLEQLYGQPFPVYAGPADRSH